MIPVADPRRAYLAQKDEIDGAIARVLDSGSYILGPEVEAFEREFAAYIGNDAIAVGCASGTDALILALRALGVGFGDKVVMPSFTAVATAAAVDAILADPVLMDIDSPDNAMEELEEILSGHHRHGIKAVIAVHLYGRPENLAVMAALCERAGVPLIEDCAQATGTTYKGQHVGTFGAISAFSFYPTKNLGALGDGGAVITKNPALAERVRSLRQYGWNNERVSLEPGINSRLDEVQAAILRAKLPGLPTRIARRREIASAYRRAMSKYADRIIDLPFPGDGHSYHIFSSDSVRRDRDRAELWRLGVGTAIHYPVPVHRHPGHAACFALGPRRCRVAEIKAARTFSLPMFPELTDAEVEHVCNALRSLR